MRIDRSLESIDFTKLAIFSLIFIAFVLIVTFAIAVPIVDKYKRAIELNSEKETNLVKIEEIYNKNLTTYENLNLQNAKALNALKNSFNEMKFISVAGRYFSDLYLSRSKVIDTDPRYIIHEAKVSATMKSPQNLYDFIASMNSYDNLVRVDFPINMESKDGYIDTEFMIRIYQER